MAKETKAALRLTLEPRTYVDIVCMQLELKHVQQRRSLGFFTSQLPDLTHRRKYLCSHIHWKRTRLLLLLHLIESHIKSRNPEPHGTNDTADVTNHDGHHQLIDGYAQTVDL